MISRPVTNLNSPMLERIARKGNRRIPFFEIPKKGRIRIVLAVSFVILCIKLIPDLVQNVKLPSIHFGHRKSTAQKPQVKKNEPQALRKHVRLADIPSHLSKNAKALSSTHLLPLSGKDSVEVYTSIDTSLKKHLDKLMVQYHPLYGAVIVIESSTGRILSLISYTNDSMPDLGTNLCLMSYFPAASTFKTITAAAAIELEHFTADCQLEHRGRTSTLYRSQIEEELDQSVNITLAQSYARSVNAVFARIGIYEIGKKRLIDIADNFGFNQQIPGELPCEVSHASCSDSIFDIAEFASGFNQRTTISPLHGALMAAAVAENGIMPIPTLVDSIRDVKSKEIKYTRTAAVWKQALQPSSVREMRKLMQAVATIGTGRKQFRDIKNSERFAEFSYGGKTGSVDKDGIGRVDWFIGYAAHPIKSDERVAVGALTVHGAYWTVHSSYLAAEAMRYYLRSIQEKKKKAADKSDLATVSDSAHTSEQ